MNDFKSLYDQTEQFANPSRQDIAKTGTADSCKYPNFAPRYALREHLRHQQRKMWYPEGNVEEISGKL